MSKSQLKMFAFNDRGCQLIIVRVKDIIRIEQNIMSSKDEFPTRIIYKAAGKERFASVKTSPMETLENIMMCAR